MSNNLKLKGSKNIRAVKEKIAKIYSENNSVSFDSAVDFLKDTAFVKFDSSVEMVVNLNIDPRHSDQIVRGKALLPHGSGKNLKVAVICKGADIEIAKKAGADAAGEDIIEEISKGNINYDKYIATPEMMVSVSSVARILGPKGLMPNLKLGTVAKDVVPIINDIKKGSVDLRNDKNGIINVSVAKLSFEKDNILGNINSVLSKIIELRPASVKSNFYIKSIYLSSTMNLSLRINFDTIELLNDKKN